MPHPDRTPREVPGLPVRRRALAWSAWALGAGTAALVAYDARRIMIVRREAPTEAVPLDHTALVGEGLAEPLDLVVLGDSAAAGYGNADPRDAFPHQLGVRVAAALGARVRVDALARSGAATRDVTAEQVPALAARDADVVVVSVGVNDALARRRSRTVESDTHDLLGAIAAAAPAATVILVGCPDLSTAPALPWPLDRMVGWRGRRIRAGQAAAAGDLGVPFAAYPRPPDPGMFGPDGLHPGPAGQRAAADIVVDVLAEAVRIPTAATPEEQRWTSA